ncbi:hypothetical protein [Modestobacter sp. L9-4]|nr:hypothetical protein [Modestobacter sp. L9-4]
MTAGVLELTGFLLTGWALAHGIEWVYRANEPRQQQDPSSSGWS